MIPVFQPDVCSYAGKAVDETIRSGHLSEGQEVADFEKALYEKFAFPNAVAVNSGTAALHLALECVGVEGREVVTTAQSFEATAMAILMARGRPVFADIEANGCINPGTLARKITPNTAAVLVVHYGGMPCDMNLVLEAAQGLPVIEDCAHALGATYKGQPVGTLGDYGCFSFQAIKQLTTGDGGLVVTKEGHRSRHIRRARWFGIDRKARGPITHLGFKYHMNDVAAAMGLAQLKCFDEWDRRRKEIHRKYREALPPQLTIPHPENRRSACWLFTLLVDRRDDFVKAMESRGVEAGAWHRRIDRHPIFGGFRYDLPMQDAFDEQQVIIPCRPSLTESEVSKITEAVKRGW